MALAAGGVVAGGDPHQPPEVISIEVSHLTEAMPYQPGTMIRTGAPWHGSKSAPRVGVRARVGVRVGVRFQGQGEVAATSAPFICQQSITWPVIACSTVSERRK